jgi:hypothetical protein
MIHDCILVVSGALSVHGVRTSQAIETPEIPVPDRCVVCRPRCMARDRERKYNAAPPPGKHPAHWQRPSLWGL